ncbi:hypothetical protein GOP47_0015308 [Adiantum capillus-veneris]|uniref:K Homology domain-containing protein n=1 Tax=Adiantum capillus-veneris TaxID=13818 RepID=A0A9D4ZCJ2_ADICA|nr:hypothetical protein GOP47_0015308 [Adiantum capillus-veneris]
MTDTRNKRKFDDSGPNISYNRVPPPPSDFERARQKALQIAARINAEAPDLARDDSNRQDDKTSSHSPMPEARSRHKFDDAGPNTLDVELAKQRAQQILARFAVQDTKRTHLEEESQQEDKPSQVQNSGQLFQSKRPEFSSGSFYAGHGPPESRKVEIPNAKVGLVIGKGGDTIKQIQLQSGARVQITKDMDHNPNVPFRTVELMGTPEQIERAEQAIHDVIAEADAAAANTTQATYAPAGEQIQLTVPTNKVGLIIGRGGETIKGLQSKTGARIQLVPLMGPPEYQSGVAERVLTLMGSKEQVDSASELIKELISENRIRPAIVQGGYQGYPPPPGPPQWGPPIQQQGYGYQQGPYYPGPPQSYGSYPPPPPAAWSQPPPAPPQQYPPPGSYGYYNSQGQVEYPPTVGYEQQGPYTEHPPGASQDVYSQQIPGQPESYGQVGAYAYGSTDSSLFGPPGVTTTSSQGGSHEGFGPPGVGESPYGKQASEQGPPGVKQEVEDVQHSNHQDYGTNENQSSMYSYDDANATSYGQHDPSHYGLPGSTHPDGQQVAGQANYGQSETGYWSNHYGYAGYETYQSSYGQQLPEHPGYGQPPYEHQQGKHSEVPYEETRSSAPTYGAGVPTSSHQQESAPDHQEERAGTHENSEKQESSHGNGYTFDTHHGSDQNNGTGESQSKDATAADQEPQS